MAKHVFLRVLVFFFACSFLIGNVVGARNRRLFLKGSSARKNVENGVSTLITTRKMVQDVLDQTNELATGNVIKDSDEVKSYFEDDIDKCNNKGCRRTKDMKSKKVTETCGHILVDDCKCSSEFPPGTIPGYTVKTKPYCILLGEGALELYGQYESSVESSYEGEVEINYIEACEDKPCEDGHCGHTKVPGCKCTSEFSTHPNPLRADEVYCLMWFGKEETYSDDEDDYAAHEYTSATLRQTDDLPDDSSDEDYMETDGNESADTYQDALITEEESVETSGESEVYESDNDALTQRETDG